MKKKTIIIIVIALVIVAAAIAIYVVQSKPIDVPEPAPVGILGKARAFGQNLFPNIRIFNR